MVSTPDAGRKGPPRPAPSGTQDLTTGPIGRTLLWFALPVMGSNILHSLNGSANAAWVSHVLGEAALTATVNANNIFFLMLGAVFGISMTANLLIAQAVGGGDEAMVRRVMGTSTSFFLVLSIAVGVGGWLLTPSILALMGTPPDATRDAITYLRVIFAAMPFLYFFSFVMMAMRGAGDSRTPFWFSLFAVLLDIVLNPVLIIGIGPAPRMGIAGSATATLASQSLVLAVMVAYLYRTHSVLALRRPDWRLLVPDLAIVRSLVAKGLPMAFQMLVISGAAVVMISYVNSYGTATAAAYGAAIQLWTYIQMPAVALGAAVSSMAAQNVGAGRMDRVNQIAGVGSLQALALTIAPIALIYAFEPWILMLFLPPDSPSHAIAQHINALVMWGFIPFGVAFVLNGIVRSTGAVWPPLLGMIIALWGLRIPFAQWLTPYLGADAIWWSFPVGSISLCLLAAGYYRWGGWRKATLMQAVPRGPIPDIGLSPPAVVEPTEAAAEAAADQTPLPAAPAR